MGFSQHNIPIGISQSATKQILDETIYTVDSDPFGQVNKEVACYNVTPLTFCGVDGVLKIMFNESTNKSTGGVWSAYGSSTRSDFKNIVKQLSGHPYKSSYSDGYDDLVDRLYYSWNTKKASYSLIWSQNQSSLVVLFSEKKAKKKESTDDENTTQPTKTTE